MAASASDRRRARAADELRCPHDPGLDQLGDQRAEGVAARCGKAPCFEEQCEHRVRLGSPENRPRGAKEFDVVGGGR